MKNILLTASGTAATWHLCQIIGEHFSDDFKIYLTDTNEKKFVPAGIFTDKFYTVPSVFEDGYLEKMYQILEDNNIDIIVPLIDFDLFYFSKDNEELKKFNIVSTAPPLHTVETLSDKEKMYKFLSDKDIPSPKLFSLDELRDNVKYVVKPCKGFGSRGVTKLSGREVKQIYSDDKNIIQELCKPGEITAEVYNHGGRVKVFQRRRVEVKSGVCTKMEPVYYPQIEESVNKLVSAIECPAAFCAQFMLDQNDDWALTDCNLRLGAGTALATKIGFQLTRALLATLAGKEVTEEFFRVNPRIKSVLRIYDEVAVS